MNSSECDVNISSEEVPNYVHSDFNRVFVSIVVPIIIVLGVTTNGLFLYTVYRIKEMRTVTNFYLAHLAVADGGLLLNSSFQWVTSFIKSPLDDMSFRTSLGCALPNFLIYMFYFASVFLVTVVIMERYVAICHPVMYRSSLGDHYRRMSIIVTVCIWTVALAFAVFTLTYSKPQRICVEWPDTDRFANSPDVVWRCSHREEWCGQCQSVVLMADLCQFCICVSTVAFMSISISYCLIRGGLKSKRTSIRSLDTMQARLHLSRMVMINAFVFFVFLTPFEIINLNNAFRLFIGEPLFNFSDTARKYIIWIGRVSMIINSAVNPIIYSAVNPRYREAVCKACCFGVWRTCTIDKPKQRTYMSYDKTNGQELNSMGSAQITNISHDKELDNLGRMKKDTFLNGNGQSQIVCQDAVVSL